jgi:hypothetical protein
MKQNSAHPNLIDKKRTFWLRCPFCQSSFVVHLFPKKVSGHKGMLANGATLPILDPEDLILLAQEIPPAQIAEIYGVSTREVVDTCRAFGIDVKSMGGQS